LGGRLKLEELQNHLGAPGSTSAAAVFLNDGLPQGSLLVTLLVSQPPRGPRPSVSILRRSSMTGARVMATPEDWKMIEAFAGRPNNRDGNKPIEVPMRDMEVREGDHLHLGDQHLIFHTAPGHTPGNLFVEDLALHDGGQTYRGIWGGGGLGAPGLPVRSRE